MRQKGIENDNCKLHSNGILFSKLILLFIDKNLFQLKITIEVNIINNTHVRYSANYLL